MNNLPYYPRYSRDWLADMRVDILSLEQQGALTRLLDNCWLQDCTLPDDEATLAHVSRLGSRWSEVGGPVRAFFVKHPTLDGKLTSPELLDLFGEIDDRRVSAARAGKASAEARAKAKNRSNSVATQPQRAVDTPLQLYSNDTSTGRCNSVPTERQHSDTDADTDTEVQVPPLKVPRDQEAREILTYLNGKTGRPFGFVETNLRPLRERLEECKGDVAGVKLMIDRQCALWEKGTAQAEYLRPITLFRKSKFDGYYASRNEPAIPIRDGPKPNQQLKAIDEAILNHPSNDQSTRHNPNCSQAERDGLKALKLKREKLISQIANV